jgi:hypothetical protein
VLAKIANTSNKESTGRSLVWAEDRRLTLVLAGFSCSLTNRGEGTGFVSGQLDFQYAENELSIAGADACAV